MFYKKNKLFVYYIQSSTTHTLARRDVSCQCLLCCCGMNCKASICTNVYALCSVAATCLLRPDAGPCRAFVTRFFYNAALNRCESFTYGGCGGNGNRFMTLAECQASRCPIPPPAGTSSRGFAVKDLTELLSAIRSWFLFTL